MANHLTKLQQEFDEQTEKLNQTPVVTLSVEGVSVELMPIDIRAVFWSLGLNSGDN